MGLSKSKVEKSAQQGFPSQPGFSTNQGQFSAFSNPATAFGSQTFPGNSGFGAPSFPPQASFPPFPSQVPGQMGGFPNNSVFNQQQVSSGFPVSFPGQPFRPMIPGYAPAPGNDRRDQQMGHMVPQGQQMQQGKQRKN